MQRQNIYAISSHAAKFHEDVEEWDDMDEVQTIDWPRLEFFDNKREGKKHRIENCVQGSNEYRCVRSGRANRDEVVKGQCQGSAWWSAMGSGKMENTICRTVSRPHIVYRVALKGANGQHQIEADASLNARLESVSFSNFHVFFSYFSLFCCHARSCCSLGLGRHPPNLLVSLFWLV